MSRERFKISAEFLDAINTKWCVVGHGADSFLQFENENTYLKYSVNFFFTLPSLQTPLCFRKNHVIMTSVHCFPKRADKINERQFFFLNTVFRDKYIT